MTGSQKCMPLACLQKKIQFDLKKVTLTLHLGENKLQRYCCPEFQEQYKIQSIKIRTLGPEIFIHS